MFNQQKTAKQVDSLDQMQVSLPVKHLTLLATKQRLSSSERPALRKRLMKMNTSYSRAIFLVLLTLPPAFADNSNLKPRWYRYYNSQGIPTLSSTISEQHLQYGYDSLDKNMQLIRHYTPFSGQRYAQEQGLREQAIARRISERHLQETYISADRATSQRDRELGDLDGQITRGQQQVTILSNALNENITSAANLERQNKPIPLYLKKQLSTNKDLLGQSQANIAALKIKREQTSKQFNDAIAALKSIEQRGNRPNPSNTPNTP